MVRVCVRGSSYAMLAVVVEELEMPCALLVMGLGRTKLYLSIYDLT